MLDRGALNNVAGVHELVHPVSGKKAIEIEWKSGRSWMVEPPTEREYDQLFGSMTDAMSMMRDQDDLQREHLSQQGVVGSINSDNSGNGIKGKGIGNMTGANSSSGAGWSGVDGEGSDGGSAGAGGLSVNAAAAKQHGVFTASYIQLPHADGAGGGGATGSSSVSRAGENISKQTT